MVKEVTVDCGVSISVETSECFTGPISGLMKHATKTGKQLRDYMIPHSIMSIVKELQFLSKEKR